MAIATPQSNPIAPNLGATVAVKKELSGEQWCARFPRSNSIIKLRPSFQLAVSSFLWALEKAGGHYQITNTLRPPESCYLMHYAWLIHNRKIDAAKVPPMQGVDIQWEHPKKEDSLAAARAMCTRYGILALKTQPALDSHHSRGEAIDMTIFWSGILKIEDFQCNVVSITSTPRNGMNADLIKVGATYGVIKYFKGYDDVPHWSKDGH